MATRQENMKKINQNKVEENKKKVYNFCTGIFANTYKKKNGKFNAVKVAEDLKIDVRTIRKYIRELESYNLI